MKFLLVQKYSDVTDWYADRVGQYLPYLRSDDHWHWSQDKRGFSNVVDKNDAIIVELDVQEPNFRPSLDNIRID